MIFVNDVPVEFGTYPNGEAVVPALEGLNASTPATVRLRWTGDHDLLHLALVRGLIRQRYGALVWPNLYVDYMPYSRMDREQDGYCFSLKHVAQAIKHLDWRCIEVVEPHSQVTLDLLDADPVWATANLVAKTMANMTFDFVRDYLVLPDEGAYKRYANILPPEFVNELNLVVLKKVREFETGKILGLSVAYRQIPNLRTMPTQPQALIIDDLSSRGGTFIQAAEILRTHFGATTVNLLVTHMEPVGYEGKLKYNLDRVYCTDTMPRPDDVVVPSNFHVYERKDWL